MLIYRTVLIIKMSNRYSEIVLDSLFSNEVTGTYIDNNLNNRPPTNIVGIALHKARIPLTFDTIFYPSNYIKWSFQSLPSAIDGNTVFIGRDRDSSGVAFGPGGLVKYAIDTFTQENATSYRVFIQGTPSPTIVDNFNYFTLSTFVGASWQFGPGDYYSWSNPTALMFLAPLYVIPRTAYFADPTATTPINSTMIIFSELQISGYRFNLLLRVVSPTTLSMAGCKMKIEFPVYLARRLGLPISGEWIIDFSQYTGVTTFVNGVGLGGPYPQVNIQTFTIPLPFAVETQLNRSLVLRGSLANEMQNVIYSNDSNQSGADVVAVVPIEGSAGSSMTWQTPNQEIFSLPRPIKISQVRLWFTRGEDPNNTPVVFNGFDYWLQFGCLIQDEDATVDSSENGNFISSGVKRFKS